MLSLWPHRPPGQDPPRQDRLPRTRYLTLSPRDSYEDRQRLIRATTPSSKRCAHSGATPEARKRKFYSLCVALGCTKLGKREGPAEWLFPVVEVRRRIRAYNAASGLQAECQISQVIGGQHLRFVRNNSPPSVHVPKPDPHDDI